MSIRKDIFQLEELYIKTGEMLGEMGAILKRLSSEDSLGNVVFHRARYGWLALVDMIYDPRNDINSKVVTINKTITELKQIYHGGTEDDEVKSLCCNASLDPSGEWDGENMIYECSKCREKRFIDDDDGIKEYIEVEFVDAECPDCSRLVEPEPLTSKGGPVYVCRVCKKAFKEEDL